MINAIEKNLHRGIKLLNTIADKEYSDVTIPPYFSSIGCHTRHILDMFSCVFKGLENGNIDFTNRERNECVELKCKEGIAYFESILDKLRELSSDDLTSQILITDDLGLGKETATTTLGAILMQTNSHTIHHYASIGYIIQQLDIELPNADFGFNPTTPKKVSNY
ncbi:DinB family protein [Polaribacter porphyrae]|uniref:DinB-like domain-containing protein n=1 Tax=Polaribacter porphyrae TaxID=1137780 RepID=A0A2S7WL18_9FLAO|nr:DinB family protein [Polaribacter porphyrae]PQJ78001.1 hypothetical protein BTO18_01825 [Polaribacter porphyrae]